MTDIAPKVSIIIAIFNGASKLRRCLESISQQTYSNRELIVIDGGSTDGTVAILNEFDARITYWISEPDTGVYNAWNKGLDHATGDWICFVGSDDYYASETGLATIMEPTLSGDYEFVTARGAVVDEHGSIIKVFGRKWEWGREKKRHYICHPGSLHHRALFERFGRFSEQYRIAADYEFNLRPGKKLKAAFVDSIIICLGNDGLCRSNIRTVIDEMTMIQSRHKDIGKIHALVYRFFSLIEYLAYSLLNRLGIDRHVRYLLIKGGLMRR